MLKKLSLVTFVLFLCSCLSATAISTYKSQVASLAEIESQMATKLQIFNAEHQMLIVITLLHDPKKMKEELIGYRLRKNELWSGMKSYETQNQASFGNINNQDLPSGALPDINSLLSAAQLESSHIDQFIKEETDRIHSIVPVSPPVAIKK
jgi:hypothetical protein